VSGLPQVGRVAEARFCAITKVNMSHSKAKVLLVPDVVPAHLTDAAALLADFGRITTGLLGRSTFLKEVTDLLSEFAVGSSVSGDKLGVLLNKHGSLKAVVRSLAPSLQPDATAAFSDLLASYKTDDVGTKEYASAVEAAVVHLGIVAKVLRGEDVPHDDTKGAVDKLLASRLELTRLADYSKTRKADVQHLEYGLWLATLAIHRQALANVLSSKVPKLSEDTLKVVSECHASCAHVSATECEQSTFAIKFLCPSLDPASVSEGISSSTKLVRDVVQHICKAYNQVVTREADKFLKLLVKDDVSQVEFLTLLKIEPIKQKIPTFKASLKSAKDSLSAITSELANEADIKKAEEVLDKGKAQVNMYAAI
jgi:hypothetical protein